MSTYVSTQVHKCWNDCMMSGCPSHELKASFNNTADYLQVAIDDKVAFGMDFNRLEALFYALNDMRGCVEIDDLFKIGHQRPTTKEDKEK